MRFSVVVPVYNAKNTIRKTITDFFANQKSSTESNCEVLLIENGSTDESAEICDDLVNEFPAVKSFHEGAIGVYSARRVGIARAEGEWLLFMDADDGFLAGSVEKLSDFIDSLGEYDNAPDIIFFDWEKKSTGGSAFRHYPLTPGKVYKEEELATFYDLMVRGDSLNALWNKCIKRTFAQEITGSYAANTDKERKIFLNHGEDLLQTAQLIDRANSITYFNEPVYVYNSNSQGLTGTYSEKLLSDQEYAWTEFDRYAEKWAKTNQNEKECLALYSKLLDSRKAVTCTIAVKNLIYSKLSSRDKAIKLRSIMGSDFYKKYSEIGLPDWASEEDRYIRGLMDNKNATNKLLYQGFIHCVKSEIKERIRK